MCRIRGFAPYGPDESKTLTKNECSAERIDIPAIIGAEFETPSRCLQSFMRSQSIFVEVLAAEAWAAKLCAHRETRRGSTLRSGNSAVIALRLTELLRQIRGIGAP